MKSQKEMRYMIINLVCESIQTDGCRAHCEFPPCSQCESIADYLIANSVVRLPCKVGDSCYPLPRYSEAIVERKISRIIFSERNIIIGYFENDGQYRPPLRTRKLGEDVFLTREEAEQKQNKRW